MRYEVFVSECKNWVQATMHCQVSLKSMLDLITSAAQVADDYGLESYLFDLRGINNDRCPCDDYQIANHYLRGLGFGWGARVALLVSQGDDSHDFLELAVSNAGYSWRLFEDQQVAQDWLTAMSAQDVPVRGGDRERSSAGKTAPPVIKARHARPACARSDAP